MKFVAVFALTSLFLAISHGAALAQNQPAGMLVTNLDDGTVSAPVWIVGQWWRLRVTNTLGHPPRIFIHHVVEVREGGYVVQVVQEPPSGKTSVHMVSKDTNFITNAVEGYPLPAMTIEERPHRGRLTFPFKNGSQWEGGYLLRNNNDAGLSTVVRGRVAQTVDLDTAFGRVKTHQIEYWWQSEGSVPYQATCMYMLEIGRCVEYRVGLETVRVFEMGFAK